MKQIRRWSWLVTALLAWLAVSALAQDEAEKIKLKTEVDGKVQVEIAKGIGTQFSFETKVVKGAPYSATAEAETIQMLTDGNRIRNKTTTTVYRDSEGRTRKELAGKTPEAAAQIFINDPVSGTSYTLHPQQRVAEKAQRRVAVRVVEEKRATEQAVKLRSAETGEQITVNGQAMSLEQLDEAQRTAIEKKMRVAKEEVAAGGKMAPAAGGVMVRKKLGAQESLGQQMIEGVMCEGKRTTITIAAGTIGNDLPINIVSEEWYAPELQALVLTKQSDPRSGETIYRLTNINRSEPARALFEVPADYTMQEAFKPVMKKVAKEEQ